MSLPAHAILLPVLLPLASAAVLVVLPDRLRHFKAGLHLLAMVASLLVAVALLLGLERGSTNGMQVYLPGNWPVPFGIVLVLDRLSAMMLVMAALAGVGSLLFALARWHRASVHFHPLLQLQLAGLNGAFLTGDLFNLFVFFEVLLAASYGLLLHGGGSLRVRAGLHYIAINLLASLLFLIGAALLYGVTGTLTMADIALKLPLVPTTDRGLLHTAAALLAVAFLAKAAFWPLNFWLPSAYAAASAPAAAMFAILTKVGVYAILRLWTLCFPVTAGDSALFGGGVLVWGGLATIVFGSIGMLRSQQLARLAGYSIITSSGTVIAAAGFDQPALTAGALFYLASSTVGAAALFLLVELVERQRQVEVDPPAPDEAVGRLPAFTEERTAADANLDDEQGLLVGRALPGALAFLGAAFFTAMLVVAGLPPLSGFVGKLAMLQALAAGAAFSMPGAAAWTMFGLLLFSGLLSTVALSRAFITHFWATQDRAAPRLRVIEGLPIVLLLGAAIGLAIGGERALGYARATADGLHDPQGYIDAVMATQPQDGPAMKRRPSLILAPALGVFWLVLNDSLAPADLLVALLVALAVPWMAAPLKPPGGPMRKPLVLARLVLRVGGDVIRSALQVGRGALQPASRPPNGVFIRVPLDLRDSHALAALAVIATVVPGSLWSELAPDRSAVLVHVFGVDDEAAYILAFKARYERPLKEIFE